MGYENIMDVLIMACGAYLIYGGITMKTTKTIPPMLLGKGIDLKRAKDIPGYIEKMFVPTLSVGILTILCGIVGVSGMLNTYVWGQTAMTFVFLAFIIAYGFWLVKMQKKYLCRK